jgi:hypothetical protein
MLRDLVEDLGPLCNVLDFGAGNGQYAPTLSQLDSIKKLSAIDVFRRENSHFPVGVYRAHAYHTKIKHLTLFMR